MAYQQIAVSNSHPVVAPGQSVARDLTCPAGKIVTSGGFEIAGVDAKVVTSRPSSASTWRVIVMNAGLAPSAITVTVWAVCIEPW